MSGRVVHINDNVPDSVYIGRAVPRKGLKRSIFHNPFAVKDSRKDAIRCFRMQFGYELNTDPRVAPHLITLRGKPLACWCRHDGEDRTEANACHGDVLIDLLEKYTDDELLNLAKAAQS